LSKIKCWKKEKKEKTKKIPHTLSTVCKTANLPGENKRQAGRKKKNLPPCPLSPPSTRARTHIPDPANRSGFLTNGKSMMREVGMVGFGIGIGLKVWG